MEALKKGIWVMLQLGVIEPSEIECSSPIIIVSKKDRILAFALNL